MNLHSGWLAKNRPRSLLRLLPLLSLALAILACGFTVGGSHIGYRPPPTTHLPAAQLRLVIQITGQYDNASTVQTQINQYH